jgi:hypothetical protein
VVSYVFCKTYFCCEEVRVAEQTFEGGFARFAMSAVL